MSRSIPRPGNAVLAERVCEPLRCTIAFAGLILIHQTRLLWFGSAEVFPQVPLVSWFLGSPAWCDDLAAWLMVISLGTLFLFFRGDKVTPIATIIFAGAFAWAVLLNQHRLQPWAWEFCILLLVMTLLPASRAVWGLRLVVASIYLHSGLSKLDVTFLTTHGESLLSVIPATFGWDFADAPVAVRRLLVALLPAGEIAVAVGLCLPKTRRVAKWCSVGMHLALLWILGPWGLGHQPGVLIWNLFFIIQNLVLFHPVLNVSEWKTAEPADSDPISHHLAAKLALVQSAEEEAQAEERRRSRFLQILYRSKLAVGYGLVAGVVLLPFLESFGWYDHWPAWAVYASRPERTLVYLAENRVPELPVELQDFLSEGETPPDAAARWLAGKPAWRRLQIDRWSLAAVNAPVYPQDRFQIGVALALAESYQLGKGIRVDIHSPANRWTGERSLQIFEGQKAIKEAADKYRLNALPREGRGRNAAEAEGANLSSPPMRQGVEISRFVGFRGLLW